MLAQNKVAKGREEHGYRHGQVERAARLNDAQRRAARMERAMARDMRELWNDEQESANA